MPRPQIFLVEDNEMEQTLARRALVRADLDCDLRFAWDGAEACEILFDEKIRLPDLILLDLHLPKLNGLEVLERIRADDRTRHIPVVMLSSSGDNNDVKESYALSANSFVVKHSDQDTYDSLLKLVLFYWLGVNRAAVS